MGALYNIAYTKYKTEKQDLLPCPFCGADANYATMLKITTMGTTVL